MLVERREQNPFDMVKASDFTDEEILEHWVDISGDHGLEHLIKPRLVMPMLLLGGKGSGKTHLMRYFSAPVQAARYGGDLLPAVRKEGYLGVYVRAEGLNTPKFAGKGQTDESWSAVFNMYFELWLATSLLQSVSAALHGQTTVEQDRIFSAGAACLFNEDVSSHFDSLSTLLDYFHAQRRSIDYIVDNAALTRDITGIRIGFSPGRLVYGLPEVIGRVYPALASVLFVYLVDEVENLTADQQKFLNSLVRYRTGNASLKIGARLYGIRTYDTLGVGEPIKRDAEYERVELDSFLRDNQAVYADFCKKLILRRLDYHNMHSSKLTELNISDSFSEMETKDYSREITMQLVSPGDREGRERPYFLRLRRLLKGGRFEAALGDQLCELLRVQSHPLLEKVALLHLYRNWTNESDKLIKLAKEAGLMARSLAAGDGADASDLKTALSYFRSDLMAQLFRECRKPCPYTGLPTLIHLSQGIPRNLLSILKQIYRRSLFNGERPFSGGRITVESQSLGVKDSAAWFWEDAQPDSQGHQVREAVEILATFFRTMRYSERPSECDCATFSIRLGDLSAESRRILTTAENWSYLIRIRDGASDKNDDSVKAKYQLGPMLAPRWGVSEHRRGTVEVGGEFGNAIFDPSERESLQRLFRGRVDNLSGEKFIKARFSGQEQLL